MLDIQQKTDQIFFLPGLAMIKDLCPLGSSLLPWPTQV